jgi:pimeloyl-ACP methyl ester carboxylesterase
VFSTFGSHAEGTRATLAIVIHGDGWQGGAAAYHVPLARKLAGEPNVVAVAMIRPGYTDGAGRRSSGDALGRIDNYTAEAIDEIAAVTAKLKAEHRAQRTIIVGYSGGAAIAGVMLGRHSGLADAALLIACPCDIAAWRAARGGTKWRRSLSPSDVVERVPLTARVIALTSADDTTTPPATARALVDKLRGRGIEAEFRALHGAGHTRILERGELIQAFKDLNTAN